MLGSGLPQTLEDQARLGGGLFGETRPPPILLAPILSFVL